MEKSAPDPILLDRLSRLEPHTWSGTVWRHIFSSEKFIEEHRGRVGDISIYGQESNYTTWRPANMNLAIRGIGARVAQGDSVHADA